MARDFGDSALLATLDVTVDVICHARPPVAVFKQEGLCCPRVASV